MSSPQLEDGYTRIANEVLEAICRIRIPGEPRQILDFIIRKTWGFGKKSDAISVAAFRLGTGLSKRRVFDALHWLQAANLILSGGAENRTSAENRTPEGKEWRINKDYDTWNLVRKTAPSAENRTKQVRKTALQDRDTSMYERKKIKKDHVLTDMCPHQKIIDLYNSILPQLPGVKHITESRKNTLRLRWKEDAERQALPWWEQFFQQVAGSDFLCGKSDRGWTADFDWLMKPANLIKILEGRYDNRISVLGRSGNDTGKPTPQRDYRGGKYAYLVSADDSASARQVPLPD